MAKKPTVEATADDTPKAGVVWREEAMQTQFANVVNVQGTRELVDIFFGTNRTWNAESGGQVTVELSNRIILTPLAAKRLSTILANVLREHERRYGTLEVE
jgi:hypothetical protein